MDKRPVISIVVPAYNEEKLIGRCLESLTRQHTQVPYEIIVVDNNSTDKTADIAKSFGVKILSEQTQSVVYARARGLAETSSDIVVGADADCVYPEKWLEAIFRNFNDNKVVGTGGPAIAENNPFWAHLIYKWGFGFVHFWHKLTKSVYYLGAFNFAFRKSVFVSLGGYRTYLDFGGDEWDVLERLKKRGRVVFDPQAFMYLSTRRYRVGFLRWLIVENLYSYTLNCWLAKLFKKSLIRAKPIRNI